LFSSAKQKCWLPQWRPFCNLFIPLQKKRKRSDIRIFPGRA
jgi:hypothetical protein